MNNANLLRQGENTRRQLIEQQINEKIPYPQPDQSIESVEFNMNDNQEIFMRKRQSYSINKMQNVGISPDKVSRFSLQNKLRVIELSKCDIDVQENVEEQKEYNPINPWKNNALIILMFIKKFIDLLKRSNSFLKLKQLDKNNFTIFGDVSSHYEYYRDRKYFNKDQPTNIQIIFSAIRQTKLIKNMRIIYHIANFTYNPINFLLDKIKVFQPESYFRLIWDCIAMLMIILNIFFIPLYICFHAFQNYLHLGNLIFNTIPNWFFIFDIVIQLNTAYYRKGVLVIQRNSVVKNYLQKSFIIDLIPLIPFFIPFQGYIEMISIISLLRCFRMIKIANNQAELLNLKDQQMAFYDLFKLLFLIIFIAHLCGCSLIYLAEIENFCGVTQTWISNKQLDNQEWFEQYISGFYWAVITMITVGYGDFTPVNSQERIFIIIMTLLSCGVFAYSINQVGSIIQNITKKNQIFRNNMAILINHMRQKDISSDLQIRVKKYFEYLNEEQIDENETGQQLLNKLSGQLRKDVLIDIYGKIIKSKKIFKLNFSDALLTELSLHMKEKKYTPEEDIYKQNEEIDKIYFIIKGTVNYLINLKTNDNQYRVIAKITKGNCIGQYPFFSGKPALFTAKSSKVVTLAYLLKSDFIKIIKNYPSDYQRFCQLKDNCNIYRTTRGLGIQCYTCDSYTHQINDCPLINFTVNKDKILYQQNLETEDQQRQSYRRNQTRLENSLQNCEVVRDTLIQFIMDNQEELKIDDVIQRINIIQEYSQKYDKNFKEQNFNGEESKNQLSSDQKIQIPQDLQQQNSNSSDYNNKQFNHNNSLKNEDNKPKYEQNQYIHSKTRRNSKKLSIKPNFANKFYNSEFNKSDQSINSSEKDILIPQSGSSSKQQYSDQDQDSIASVQSKHSIYKQQNSSLNTYKNMNQIYSQQSIDDHANQPKQQDLNFDTLFIWNNYYNYNNIDKILSQYNKVLTKSKIVQDQIQIFKQNFQNKYSKKKKKTNQLKKSQNLSIKLIQSQQE